LEYGGKKVGFSLTKGGNNTINIQL
jgi:hypothetical protein